MRDWYKAPSWWVQVGRFKRLSAPCLVSLFHLLAACNESDGGDVADDPLDYSTITGIDTKPSRIAPTLERLEREGFIVRAGGRIRLARSKAEHQRIVAGLGALDQEHDAQARGRVGSRKGTGDGQSADTSRTAGGQPAAASCPPAAREVSADCPSEPMNSEDFANSPHARVSEEKRGDETRGEENRDPGRTCDAPESASPREEPRPAPELSRQPSPQRPCLELVREDCRDHARRWLDRLGLELATDRSAGTLDGAVVGGIRVQPPRARRRPNVWDQARSSPAALEADHADRLAEMATADPEAFRDAVDRHLDDTRGWGANPLAWLARGVEFAREDLDARGSRARGRRAASTGVQCGPAPLDEIPEPLDGPMTAAELRLLGGLHA